VQLVAGDSAVWTRTLSSYSPADGWVLHYRIIGPYELASDPTVTVVNGTWQATLAASATAAAGFIAGTYRLMGWVDGVNAERYTIYDGAIEILPNLAVVTWDDTRGHVDRIIDACEAALEGRLSSDVARYGREGVFVDKLDLAEIKRTLATYKAKKWRADNPGVSFPHHVVAFGQPASRPSDAEALAFPGYPA
jgi:hypothetical protein